MHKRKFFICFTGMDGTGKTTQAKRLVETLNGKGIKCHYVWNTYQNFFMKPLIIIARLLFFRGKDAFQDYSDYSHTRSGILGSRFVSKPYEWLVLFDYLCQTLVRIIIPRLLGKSIVCDRYLYDVVINLHLDLGYSRDKGKKLLHSLQRILPRPDMVFVIDIPPEVGIQRKNDVPSIEYLEIRRDIYLALGKEYKLTALDGSLSIAELEVMIREKAIECLG